MKAYRFAVYLLPLLLLFALNSSFGATNVTITNSTSLSANFNASGWIIIAPGVSLNTNGYNLSSHGLLIAGTLTTLGNNAITTNTIVLNQSSSILNIYQNTLNVSTIINYGLISHTNALELTFSGYGHANGTSFLNSYGGSGGGISTTYGYFNGSIPSGYNGGNTLAKGGVESSGTEPSSSLTNYTYNQGLLEGATGGYFVFPGDVEAYAGYGLVFTAANIANYGLIQNNVPLSYMDGSFGQAVGGGGAGVVELLYNNSLVEGTVVALGGNGTSASAATSYPGGNAPVFAFKIALKVVTPPTQKTTNLTIKGNCLLKTYDINTTTFASVVGNCNLLKFVVVKGGNLSLSIKGEANLITVVNGPVNNLVISGNANVFGLSNSNIFNFTDEGNTNLVGISNSTVSSLNIIGDSNILTLTKTIISSLIIDGNSNILLALLDSSILKSKVTGHGNTVPK